MRSPIPAPTRRARAFRAAAVVVAACALAALPGIAIADAGSDDPVVPIGNVDPNLVAPSSTGTEPAAPGADLVDPTAPAPAPTAGAATTDPAATADEPGDELDHATPAQLTALRARLAAERNDAQARLLRLETARSAAEVRLDAAVAAWTNTLVAIYDAGGGPRIQALQAVRDANDPTTRAPLVAALQPADRAMVQAYDAASAANDRAAVAADEARTNVLSLGTRIDAIDLALEADADPGAAQSGGRAASHYAVDADLMFATGPIPGIGYWGAVSGGGMLSGWTGFASAAVGGVGCTPPDPALKATGSIEQGDASWYGPGFDGHTTSNGETYDQEAMTAAHRTLPFGTIVRVYSSTTARCAFVRINDRGPFVDGRIIDLSHAAATQLGMSGTAPVQVEVWSVPGAPVPAATTTPTAPLAAAPPVAAAAG